MAFEPQRRTGGAPPKKRWGRRKICRFCSDKNSVVDYKDIGPLRQFISERGKIVPRRISGSCALHQRQITLAIKRARLMALLPFSTSNTTDQYRSETQRQGMGR